MSACIYDDYPSPPEGTDTMLANARRIARLPDLEIDYLALVEEIARLRAALKPFADIGVGTDPDYQPQIRLDRDAILAARAALGETK
jgi:predicted metal-dependent hydrolase